MLLEEFDFDLPAELIANVPAPSREDSRMLIVDRRSGTFKDKRFVDLVEQLRFGDLLVLNNTRVFPARLGGRTETGAKVEILLEEELGPQLWSAIAKPAKRLKAGKAVKFDDTFACEVVSRNDHGRVVLRFGANSDVWNEVERVGKTPLPHYIARSECEHEADRERYQTVYAERNGAIAAPTAGLHFTNETFDRLAAKGVMTAAITLHVGYGTFEPIRVEDLSEHRVLPERIEVTAQVSNELNLARDEGRRIVAVGTTTTRALESCVDPNGRFSAQKIRTSLTVTPGFRFRAVDALLTNFHLPRSSLLVLVSTFGGHELIMRAYEHAVGSGYRFFSYGDCMFIE